MEYGDYSPNQTFDNTAKTSQVNNTNHYNKEKDFSDNDINE